MISIINEHGSIPLAIPVFLFLGFLTDGFLTGGVLFAALLRNVSQIT